MRNKTSLLIFFICLLYSVFSNSQNDKIEIKGTVVDEFNNLIPYAAVGIIKKYIGTASTEDGEFSFYITKSELQDSISVSNLGYETYKIKVSDYLDLAEKVIKLKEANTELDEVTLLPISHYVFTAIEKLKENTLSDKRQLTFLFRRAAEEDGKAKFLVENYIKVKDRGPAYRTGIIQVVESRKSADYRYWKRKQWQHAIHGMYNVNPIKPNNSMHKVNLKRFKWVKIGDSSYEDEDVIVVEGKHPKLDWEKIKIYIGIDSYKIYKIERRAAIYIYKKHVSGKMVLSYYRTNWGFPRHAVPEHLLGTSAESLHYKVEAFVLDVETDKKKMKAYPYGDDMDMGILDLPYNPDFWKNLSVPPDTKFYTRIKNELEGLYGVSLEKQYQLVNK